MKKSIISFILIIATTVGLVACNPFGGAQNSTGDTIKTTETYLVKNGVSPYSIVLPEETSEDLNFAAEELQYFFSLSTGYELEVISETQVSDVKGKYLSIGDTNIAEASGVDLSYETLGTDGYQLKTFGDAVVMAGNTDRASLFSIYGFLAKQFDLEIYTTEVFTYKEVSSAKLIDVEITDIPDIPQRSGGTFLAEKAGLKALARYRMREYTENVGAWGHQQMTILDKTKYLDAHPEWYNETQTAIAWENEQMWDTFAEELIKLINTRPNNKYWVIGQEDVQPKCWSSIELVDEKTGELICGKRKYDQMKAENGGTDSAVQILFLNYVVRKVNEYFPNNDYMFAMFAYDHTQDAPVVYNSKTGKYEPYNDDVVFEKNLGVSLAMINSRTVSHSYLDKEYNPDDAKRFAAWQALTDKFMVWGYSTNFGDFISPFNSWGSIKANYAAYAEMGVQHLYEQGCQYVTPNYMELRQYLVAKLSWDTSLDTEVLIKNFMKAYYRDGFEPMYEYFNLMRNRLTEIEVIWDIPLDVNDYQRLTVSQMYNTDCFPKTFVDKCEALIDEALVLVDAVGDAEARLAIEKDRMPLRVVSLSIHKDAYPADVYLAMVQDFERLTYALGSYTYSENSLWAPAPIINGWITQ